METFVFDLPQRGGMRVPGRVYASEGLFARAREDKALEQVENVAHLPGIVGWSFAMPDIHWGYGFPIGGVCATDVDAGGVVSPGGVGFDISCGVRLLRTPLTRRELDPRLDVLVRSLARIPRGTGADGLMPLDVAGIRRVLTEGVAYAIDRGAGSPDDADVCEDGGVLDGADPGAVSSRAVERGLAQLGSLGGGNHFLEVQVVDAVLDPVAADGFGLSDGQIVVMIHCGSRGLGHQVCTDEVRTMDRAMERYGISVPDRQLACAPVASPEGARYLAAMSAAANYGRANRQVLTDGVRKAFRGAFGTAEIGVVYDVSHNLAKLENYGGRTLCVHRKGATRAFGPGHPEIPERYRGVGQPVLVPGSMGTASYVLAGTAEGRDAAWWSACHGAGRTMSRNAAAKRMKGAALRDELKQQGIVVVAKEMRLLSEEAPYAYKDVSEVVSVCERAGLTRTVARLRPIAVIKG